MTMNGTTHSVPPPPGSYVPCLTFFNDDESLDMDAIKAHALRMAQGGLSGLVIHGSNGEAVHLSAEERKQSIIEIRAHLRSNGFPSLPIIAGTGAPSLQETLRLTQDAKEAGANYAMVLSPSYWAAATKPHLIKFFTKLADASPLPIIIYNFPAVSNGIDLDSGTLLELAKHPNIVGCKLTCANIGKTHRVAHGTDPNEFAVIAGKSEVFLHSLVAGASGVVAGACNICPKLHVELWNRYQAGDLKGAKELQDIFSDADAIVSGLGLGNLKLLVSQHFGYGNGVSRSPLPSGSKDAIKGVENFVNELVKREKAL